MFVVISALFVFIKIYLHNVGILLCTGSRVVNISQVDYTIFLNDLENIRQ